MDASGGGGGAAESREGPDESRGGRKEPSRAAGEKSAAEVEEGGGNGKETGGEEDSSFSSPLQLPLDELPLEGGKGPGKSKMRRPRRLGLLHMWVPICTLRLPFVVKARPQNEHLKGLSPV